MRALSIKQASRCETAEGKVCKCRCGGQFHGAKRGLDAEFHLTLGEDDPHHVPTKESRRQKERRLYLERQRVLAFGQ